MLATGQQADVARLAGGFLGVLKWAMIPMALGNALRTIISALGRPGYATLVTLLALGVNAAGNYLLVFGHGPVHALGLNGSALANVITAVATLLAYGLLLRFDRRLRRYHLLGRWWRPDWARLRDIARLGTPIALQVLAEAGLFSAAAFLMGRLGQAELAAHTLALQVAAFTFQIPFGIGQAATIRVGYFYGARDPQAQGRAGWVALGIGLGIASISASAMVLFPRAILSAYVDVDAPERAAMVALAMRYLIVAAAFQLVDATQAIIAGALRGLQDTRVPMLIAMLGYWLPGFGTSLALGFGTPLRGFGIWIGLATGLAVVSALLLPLARA
jgi:MATE family multidrug resistance protein